jgi:hypothetical protein
VPTLVSNLRNDYLPVAASGALFFDSTKPAEFVFDHQLTDVPDQRPTILAILFELDGRSSQAD